LFTELSENEYIIGRADYCNVQITDSVVKEPLLQTISKKHCRIVKTMSGVYLEDYSSSGTYVNSEKIGKGNKRILKNSDQISLVVPHFKGLCVNRTVT
jgi:serine/threonine-protein kinase Chk2